MANLSAYQASQFGGNLVNDLPVGGVASKSDGQTIAHGLGVAPSRYGATATVSGHIVGVTAVSSTTLTVSLTDAAGAAVNVAENIAWWAAV